MNATIQGAPRSKLAGGPFGQIKFKDNPLKLDSNRLNLDQDPMKNGRKWTKTDFKIRSWRQFETKRQAKERASKSNKAGRTMNHKVVTNNEQTARRAQDAQSPSKISIKQQANKRNQDKRGPLKAQRTQVLSIANDQSRTHNRAENIDH